MGKNRSQHLANTRDYSRVGLQVQEIDLSRVPYFPLPPAPNSYDTQWKQPRSAESEFFEIADESVLTLLEVVKVPMPDRPHSSYRDFLPTSTGCIFIDKSGKGAEATPAQASLLLRDQTGTIAAKADLRHDIYRSGSIPSGPHAVFLSSEGIIHGYDQDLKPSLEHNLANDPRTKIFDDTNISFHGPLRTRIRNVCVSSDGARFIFTIADTAWCFDPLLSTLWGSAMPLKDNWERVLTRSNSIGDKAGVHEALSIMGLDLPLNMIRIKERYRKLALDWHPDLNPQDEWSTERMQQLNQAFEILTGIDAESLELNPHEALHFRKTKPDFEMDFGGFTLTMEVSSGPGLDWIYAANFAADNRHAYLGSYAGKIVKVDAEGIAVAVVDIGAIPRRISDTGDNLMIRTDTRLYLVSPDYELIELIDTIPQERIIPTTPGFGVISKKNLRWFSPNGEPMGEVRTKHPLRAFYISDGFLQMETRQHRARISLG